jgi:nucleotide-binding universal stress UspA family protein
VNGFPEKVLLATDGLESTALASRAAVDLAMAGGAELHVVHVWHTVHFDRLVRSGLEDAGRETLEEQLGWIEEQGGTVAGTYLREGRAVEEIIEQAEEIGAGLVIVGSRGMGRLGRMVMGSVSTGLAHRSTCPVLIVREGEEAWPPERVLVGYGSFEATERAGFLGASLGQALGVGVELVGTVSDANADDSEVGSRDMERALSARADEIEEVVGQRPQVRPLVGDVPRAILDVQAEEQKPILLSFGSKVLGRAGRVMVGEVLDRVLGETSGPILVTPEPHPASKAGILERAEIGAKEAPAVLVATDVSEVSLRAGEYAARLVSSLGAKLYILYVVDEHLLFHTGIHYGEFIEKLTQDGREATGKVRALAEKVGVKAEELVVLGRPEQTILSVAEELEADPIFLGAEGMSRLEHALVGSVSEEALRHANRTVIVVGGHLDDGSSEGENPGAGR